MAKLLKVSYPKNHSFEFIQKMMASNFHIFEAIVWDETEQTDIYVMSLKDGSIQQFTTHPMYPLHHANAYQLNKVIYNLDLKVKV